MKFTSRLKNVNSSFEYLEKSVSEEEAEKYYLHWHKKYSSFFDINNAENIIAMANRSLRARREIITSATLFEEAKVSRNNGCVSATYFLVYYSVFHAMWAALFVNSEVENNINEVTHQKLKNLFCDFYTRGNFFDVNMKEYIIKLKDMREFFSYNVPFNIVGDALDFDEVETILLKCYQITNFHNNLMLECKCIIPQDKQDRNMIEKYFRLFNDRTKDNGENVCDPAEKTQLYEMIKYGARIDNYEFEIGHDWDEMGYSGYMDDKFDYKQVYVIKGAAMRLVYKAIKYL